MSFVPFDRKIGVRMLSIAVLAASGLSLAGCANVGDGFASGAFVDPAKYDLFDCKQLEAERKKLEACATELQGYIDKARTGTAGTVVGEVAYRNDYISTRASLKLANKAWERGKCSVTLPLAAPLQSSGTSCSAR
jgi:hypothetical protein